MSKLPGFVLVCIVFLVVMAGNVLANNVVAGDDPLQVIPPSSVVLGGAYTIPADFFDPGSDPFAPIVNLVGEGFDPTCGQIPQLGMVVRRLQDAQLPVVGSNDIIQIEIVELQLVSIQPITVEYNGGVFSEQWDVHVDLSQNPQQQGNMDLNHTVPNGGTFSSFFPVQPRFVFIRQGDNAMRVLDTGIESLPADDLSGASEWAHTVNLGCPPCFNNFYPGTDGNTIHRWNLRGFGFDLTVQIPCTPPVPVEETTWGAVKELFSEVE